MFRISLLLHHVIIDIYEVLNADNYLILLTEVSQTQLFIVEKYECLERHNTLLKPIHIQLLIKYVYNNTIILP